MNKIETIGGVDVRKSQKTQRRYIPTPLPNIHLRQLL